MERTLRAAAAIALLAIAFVACNRGASEAGGFSHERDVYVAGNEISAENIGSAAYWKNGAKTPLGQGTTPTAANSIHVVGSHVYVAGYEETAPGTSVALYWLNGQPHRLSQGHRNDTANSVFVFGDQVYVAGVERNSATIWVNGVSQRLSPVQSEATSVFVSDSDVYAAGWEESVPGKQFAVLWVNGEVHQLSGGGRNNTALSVIVSGSTVYAAGYEEVNNITTATLWKNGTPIQIGQNGANSYAKCVWVAGSKVYVVLDENGYAKISTNGKKQLITDKSSRVYSVCVSGSDVYTAGSQGRIAKLWLNGRERRLQVAKTSKASEAKSVFVQ